MAEAMKESRVEAQLKGKEIKKIIFVPGRILNIVAK
jgi:leucyl-tRNA synthetase